MEILSTESGLQVPVWGNDPQDGELLQVESCAVDASAMALMGDHHLGYAVPVGGVVAYQGKIPPAGVGYDIACGNKAVRLDTCAAEVRPRISEIMDEIARRLSFGVGMKNEETVEDDLFKSDLWSIPAVSGLRDLAQSQLGTIGSGNHYVDVFVDESDDVWCGVHFGSRGLGHKTATWFLNALGAKDEIHAKPLLLETDSQLGQEYLGAMDLAGQYAYAGRNWVCDVVAEIVGSDILESVHNHHNFAWKEEHTLTDASDGPVPCWVVRKGATPAFPGQLGFVGASMVRDSVILRGKPTEDLSDVGVQERAMGLCSTVHGAGRKMGRMAAKGKRGKDGEWKRAPGVTGDAFRASIEQAGVEVRGAGVDESVFCYKSLPDVLQSHSETVEVLRTLTPIGVAMAGPGVKDPFRD